MISVVLHSTAAYSIYHYTFFCSHGNFFFIIKIIRVIHMRACISYEEYYLFNILLFIPVHFVYCYMKCFIDTFRIISSTLCSKRINYFLGFLNILYEGIVLCYIFISSVFICYYSKTDTGCRISLLYFFNHSKELRFNYIDFITHTSCSINTEYHIHPGPLCLCYRFCCFHRYRLNKRLRIYRQFIIICNEIC
ncbi:MAG: hypothetical protein BWY64_03992 [bacterium ADurb.Bin363]|nr:MAG: hypothetical protein BWY64_03992 [bacterium ADurb.Bin363]